jgi:hypothetical protein
VAGRGNKSRSGDRQFYCIFEAYVHALYVGPYKNNWLYLRSTRTKQDKGSMPLNDYPVTGQAGLNIVMDAINEIRLPDVNDRTSANPDIGNSMTVFDNNTGY